MKSIKIAPSLYTQSRIEYRDGRKIVSKCYSSVFGIKWFLISRMFYTFPYASQPLERMGREIEFFTFRWKDIGVPKIIDMDYDRVCLFREFIDGKEVDKDRKSFELIGNALRKIHEAGFVMGDTKLSNFMIKEDKVFVIDAEQAIRSSSKDYIAWDILVFFLFSSFAFVNEVKDYRDCIRSFVTGYGIDGEIAMKITDIKNVPLLALFSPLHLIEIKKISAEFL
ncbi:hypothetical protein [Sulfuracidifex tepidarius]|uniref:Serine/threonine protein kinase n=1 Tax=Sulfuracidifex tepidarius TaxID=1294262 RepID=A0A510DUM6_9CREN|nr:hypothetical protein [Sulfuracidifex tepidarius]BBG23922.1 hypothetical protein IC006_1220 [Sulfuracidifex tepidarius]BBG26677.1 hypothetical protein IC007_1195 [Sulfuracidifex tepidarius]